MQKYVSSSENETKKIAADLAKNSKAHIFALTGELGAGKTVFVQGFAKALGIKEKIISPTFILIRQHQIPTTMKVLYHIDLYRLENIKNLHHLGLEELWSNPGSIVIIEWAEKIKKQLPKNTTWISISIVKNNVRKITISAAY